MVQYRVDLFHRHAFAPAGKLHDRPDALSDRSPAWREARRHVPHPYYAGAARIHTDFEMRVCLTIYILARKRHLLPSRNGPLGLSARAMPVTSLRQDLGQFWRNVAHNNARNIIDRLK